MSTKRGGRSQSPSQLPLRRCHPARQRDSWARAGNPGRTRGGPAPTPCWARHARCCQMPRWEEAEVYGRAQGQAQDVQTLHFPLPATMPLENCHAEGTCLYDGQNLPAKVKACRLPGRPSQEAEPPAGPEGSACHASEAAPVAPPPMGHQAPAAPDGSHGSSQTR